MRFLDEEVLEVFVIHVDGATCESVTWEHWKSEVVLPWHAILYSGGMPIFVIG